MKITEDKPDHVEELPLEIADMRNRNLTQLSEYIDNGGTAQFNLQKEK